MAKIEINVIGNRREINKSDIVEIDNKFDFSEIKAGSVIKKSDFLKLFSTKDIINSSPGFFCIDKIDTKSFIMLNAADVIVCDNKLFNLWSRDGADICLRFGEKKKVRDFEVYIEKLNHMDEFLVIREIIDNIQAIENDRILSSKKDYTFTFEDITVYIPKGI